MAKLNREKVTRDLEFLAARFGIAIDIILFSVVVFVLAVGLYFSAKFLLNGAQYFPVFFPGSDPILMLIHISELATMAVLPITVTHFARANGGTEFVNVLQRLTKSKNKLDRQFLRKYILTLLLQGAAVLVAGDAICFVVREMLGIKNNLICLISWVIGVGLAVLCIYLRSWFRFSSDSRDAGVQSTLIRGTLLNTFTQAKSQANALVARLMMNQPTLRQYFIRWAGIDLPGDIESHFGIVGISGSGKTLALQTLMRSVIPTIRDANPGATAQRALVFDPENKFIPLLQSLAGAENVHILNPFDRRSRPWDVANDIEDLATAQEMASIFIPEQKGDSQPFWQRTARGILSAVLKSLHMKAPGRWTLRQVFHIMTNEERLTAVLSATNQTQGLIDLLRPTNTTLFNVLAELRSHMDLLELVSALWDNSVNIQGKKPFTLKWWLEGQSVLVFGRPTQLEDTVLALNRVIIKRASQLIRAPMLKEQADARGRTWIFLDELRNIGNLPGLDKLLTEGRSRGARVVMTFQDIDGLREVYSDRIAEEIANQCDTMSYLRCRGTTAKWAAERLGRCEYWDKDSHSGTSQTSGQSPSTTVSSGTNVRKNLTDAVLESQLSGLPTVKKQVVDEKPGAFVQGWHVVSAIECIYPTGEKDAWYPFDNVDTEGRFEKRLPEDQILRPWDEEMDWKDLGFKPDRTAKPFKMPDVDSLRG